MQQRPFAPRPVHPGRFVLALLAVFFLLLLAFAPSLAGAADASDEAEPGQQAERVKVGDEALDFTLESLEGETYRLSDLEGEKQVILIFFRGAW